MSPQLFILGGAAIILIERLQIEARVSEVEALTPATALKIGAFQCLALIPGMSRAGATIIGALIAGVERKAAAEFSFCLAIPVIIGATVFDVWGNRDVIDGSHLPVLATGFVAAFFSALVVVKWFVGFVSRHGFAIFGWYRIAFGCLLLAYYLTSLKQRVGFRKVIPQTKHYKFAPVSALRPRVGMGHPGLMKDTKSQTFGETC